MNYKVPVIIVLLSSITFSAVAEDFKEYLRLQNTSYLKDDVFFEENIITENKEFKLYRKKLLKAFTLYKKKISQVWGENNTVVSTKTVWAEYQDNLQQRQIVNFKKGLVSVEIILEGKQADNNKLIEAKLNQALVNSITSTADSRSIFEVANSPDKVEIRKVTPVLENLVKDKNGNVVTPGTAEKFARKVAGQTKRVKRLKGQGGKKRVVVSANYKLVPNHIRILAKRFKPLVNKYAEKFVLSKKLIYAIIETESFFNPVARSNAPAFGLMQLVPHYGAREAYRFIFKKDKVVSASFLYNANNNIKLGSAYLHVLNGKYMQAILNKQSRLWCTIAAYNTGPSNVFRAIAGKYRRKTHHSYQNWKKNAIRKINKMSSEQLFAVLKQKLPYSETRDYIYNVRKRMGKYAFF